MKILERYGQHLVRNSKNGWIAVVWLGFGVFFTFISITQGDSLDRMVIDQKSRFGHSALPSLGTLAVILATMMYSMSLGFFQQWCIWRAFRQHLEEKEPG
jgi:hypothetical protein